MPGLSIVSLESSGNEQRGPESEESKNFNPRCPQDENDKVYRSSYSKSYSNERVCIRIVESDAVQCGVEAHKSM